MNLTASSTKSTTSSLHQLLF